MSDSIIHDVTDTAFWIAQFRAEESARPDALFRDPVAAELAGARGRELRAQLPGPRLTGWNVAIRTHMIDRWIQETVANDQIDCVLNLGAGLDARPFRLELARPVAWIEVDYASVLAYKSAVLKGKQYKFNYEALAVDLTDREERRQAFTDVARRHARIFVLSEGVIAYLDNAQAEALARDLRAHASFKYWLLDYIAPPAVRYVQRARRNAMSNAPFQFNPENWSEFFRNAGWMMSGIRYLSEESRRLGRRIPFPFEMQMARLLMGARKRDETDHYLGYALLERTPTSH